MKILCLHGRGSNNEIFRMQTAPIRSFLDDFEFVFVQGTVRHTEGNWSLHTADFSKFPLYAYYNALDPSSIVQTHAELREIIAREGPFDGVLGYSGGAALASELLISQDPLALDPIFRFAIFINGASPLRVFKLEDAETAEDTFDPTAALDQARSMFLRPSALRHKDGVSEEDQANHAKLLSLLDVLEGKMLADGTPFLSNGTFGLSRWDLGKGGGPLINIPTLHIRSVAEDHDDPHHGLHLLGLCEPSEAQEIHHGFGHDFPRGRQFTKQIADTIRDMAEGASAL
ncbi:hypothetical protein CERZMDRAFT_102425 [Cercospora zeae-maydis SCOH1-5]|uniref:Serine hydrolase domain-containing protein n=1 Tax=Cercospora zeae-maydis SCOH1-5 TaxID=717836 RepID=A0A6A6EYK6_9PEZI|nr:hypothetical protein CERZMDRAFT_102425 [Cercospora zeae-maydis SCOH1-5]